MRIKHLYSPVWGSSLQVPPLQRAKETEILIVCTQRFHLPHRHNSESNPKTMDDSNQGAWCFGSPLSLSVSSLVPLLRGQRRPSASENRPPLP